MAAGRICALIPNTFQKVQFQLYSTFFSEPQMSSQSNLDVGPIFHSFTIHLLIQQPDCLMNKHMIRKQSLFDSQSFRAKCCKIMVLFFLQTFGEMNLQLRGYGRPDQVYAMEARTSQLPGYFYACMHPQFWVDADTLHRGVLPCRKQRPVQGWERSHVHRLD